MSNFKTAAVTLIVAASVTISVVIHHRAQLRLREHDESLRQKADDLAQLSAENERLSGLIAQVKTSQSLSRDQLMELLRLRNEVGQIRRGATEGVQLQATNSQLRAMAAKVDKQLADAQAAPNYWPKDQLAFAGYADPESAMKTILATMNNGNLDSWRRCCTTQAVASLEWEWKKHGLSEEQAGAELKTMTDALISSASGFHILDQKMPSPDEAVINLSFDGEGKARTFVLKKVGDEWKFHNLFVAGQEPPESK